MSALPSVIELTRQHCVSYNEYLRLDEKLVSSAPGSSIRDEAFRAAARAQKQAIVDPDEIGWGDTTECLEAALSYPRMEDAA